MGLHHSFHKMINGDLDHYERAQLWFLLYVCDHQFSTTYGRPPTIHEDSTITGFESFLQFPTAVPGDVRLMAQVTLFIIHSQVFRRFGTDSDRPIGEADFEDLRHYNVELDQWRNTWQPRSANSQHVHTYPSKGVTLHYYFAKFQFNSLTLRAISNDAFFPLSTARKESANLAISSAMSTLAFILDEPDVRNNITGIPLFAHTMLAFSAVFLLKVTLKWNHCGNPNQILPFAAAPSATISASLYINFNAVEDLVDRVILLLHNTAASEKHLTRHIARGLSKMLASFKVSMRKHMFQDGQQHKFATPPSQHSYQETNQALQQQSGKEIFAAPSGSLLDKFGFSFNEAWQDFPSTTLDFLTSEWQDAGFK